MIRPVQIAMLLVIVIPFGVAKSQTPTEAIKKFASDWRSCVQAQVSAYAAQLDDWESPAEKIFAHCRSEEELFIAGVNAGAPTENAARQTLFVHFRDKVVWKKKIIDDHFAAIVKRMSKQ